MKRFLLLFTCLIAFSQIKSQCFEIQSILVDACAGSQEGQNEMVIFKVGSTALNTANMSVNWPNNSWLGLTQNAGTAADIATVNATIFGCGFLREPVAGVLPANAKVLLVTSTAWTPLAQSFANLNDTLYVIFQTAGNTSGHFANYNTAAGLRTLTITFNPPVGCTDAVTYDRTLLVNQAGNLGAQDGGAVDFTTSGTPTYVNKGCQAPFIPLSVNAGADKTICATNTQTFSATASGVYTSINWSLGAGATGTFVPTNSVSTTYSPGSGDNGTIKLYVTILKACGTSTTTVKDSVLLTITPLPTLTLSPNNVAICAGQSATVTAAANTAVTYTWSNSANTSSVSLNSAGVYTCNVSNACGNATGTVNVTLSASPTLSVAASAPSICANGQTVTLTASGSSGTYLWSNGANTATTSITSPGVYTATVTTPSCGTAVNSITVAAIPFPTVSISVPSTTVCSGSSLTFTANSSSGNYLWTGGATTQTISVNTPSISVTATNVCGTAQATQTLNIVTIPTISVNNANVNLCSGQSATVTATSSATSYTWNPGSINTNTIALSTAGIYTVSTSNLCGSSSTTVDVVVTSVPTVSVASSSSSICASGQTATLTLSGSSGTYTWSNGGSTSTNTINTPGVYTATVTTPSCGSATTSIAVGTSPLPTVTISVPSTTVCSGSSLTFTANSSSGNYLWSNGVTTNTVTVNSPTISVTSTNVCGSAQASQTLNVILSPTVAVSNANVNLCAGQSSTVTATSNAINFNWSPGSISTSSIALNSAGVYSVTASNACGNAIETVTVTLGALPSVTASATQTLICSSQSSTLSVAGSTGSYLWSNGATTSTTSVNTSGLYTVSVTTTCGQAVSSVSLTVLPSPSVSLSASSSTICAGQTSTIIAQGNVTNYSWSNGGTSDTQLINTPGVITVSVSNTCGVATASTIIFSNSLPVLNLTTSSSVICPNETATLTVTGGNAPYSWSNSSNTGSVVTTTGGTVSVSNTNVCGTTTETIGVLVVSLNASISANPITGTAPLIVNFGNNSVGATSYLWDFGNGLTASTQTVSSQTYTTVGSYVVYLFVTSGTCLDVDSLTINVINEGGTLEIPNVFTPNDDSINDIFKVRGFNISEFNCTIFDRWGLQMHAWEGIKNGWNGKSNDKDVPAGTYFFIINAKDLDGKEIKKQGYLNLFR
jgi:gliding motility-associated-like protein